MDTSINRRKTTTGTQFTAEKFLSAIPTEMMADVAAALHATVETTQEKFVALGEDLQGLYKESDHLVQSVKSAVEQVRDGTAHELLDSISVTVQRSVAFLRSVYQGNLLVLDKVRDTIAVVKKLQKSTESISTVATQLGIIGTNLAIQTSKLSWGLETFGDFPNEIKSFSAYIGRFAADIEQDADNVISTLINVTSQMSSSLTGMLSFIEQVEGTGHLAVGEVHDLLKRSAEEIAEESRRSEKISEHVSRAVIALQVDDITRQRLVHVLEALASIDMEKQRLDPRMLVRLQATQVREVSKTLQRAHEDIVRVFGDMGAEISQMTPGGSSNKFSNKEASHSLRNLQKTLVDFGAIHQSAIDLRHLMADGLERAVDGADAISRHVVEISTITQELNLKAINALLMSRQMGSSGNNLVVLAKELHTLSKDSIGFVTLVKEDLEHVADVTTLLKQTSMKESYDDERAESFEDQIRAVEDTISFMNRSENSTKSQAVELKRRLDATVSGLDFWTTLVQRTGGIAETLSEIAESVAPNSDLSSEEAVEQAHALYAGYTMEQERRVHRSMEFGDIPENDVHPENTDEDNLDVGDFELF